jgi:hypothetical protein
MGAVLHPDDLGIRDVLRRVLGLIGVHVGVGAAVDEKGRNADLVELEIGDLRKLIAVGVQAGLSTPDGA